MAALNQQIDREIRESKQAHWRAKVEKINTNSDLGGLWKLAKALTSDTSQSAAPNRKLAFPFRTGNCLVAAASGFNRLFNSAAPNPPLPALTSRRIRRHLRTSRRNLEDSPIFTTEAVATAIAGFKSSPAVGPDGLSIILLKHLGPLGLAFLATMLSQSVRTATLPVAWQQANIVPLPKKGKDLSLGASYRPISLLSPIVKVLERLVMPTLTAHLAPSYWQHGFRPRHSTTTALVQLSTTIATGFNKKKPAERTVAVAVDVSKAFDAVDRVRLLGKIDASTLPDWGARFLASYLSRRSTRVLYGGVSSPLRRSRHGVPQGAVSSPLLYNFFVADMPIPPADAPTRVIGYADDTTILGCGTTPEAACAAIRPYLLSVEDWMDLNGLQVSAEKSQACLFTPFTAEFGTQLDVRWHGSLIPTSNRLKILGVTFDSMAKFGPHVDELVKRAGPRVNVQKSVAGTDWGCSKKMQLVVFKGTVQSLFNYAAPAWFPWIAPTHVQSLQRVQNTALRAATGCYKIASKDHLSAETKVLPVADKGKMLCHQSYIQRLHPDHPNHNIFPQCQPRAMKATLSTYYTDSWPRLPDLDDAQVKAQLQLVHRAAAALAATRINRVLGEPPPPIHKSAETLSRPDDCILSQLRSGHSLALGTYRNLLDSAKSELCPSGCGEEHTSSHLFNCRQRPVPPNIDVKSLWKRPVPTNLYIKTEWPVDP